MIDINEVISKISEVSFFSNMGTPDIQSERVILIENVGKAFVNPSDTEFKGLYSNTEWLPSSPTEEDPFYKDKSISKELTDVRIRINKAIMVSTRGLSRDKFMHSPHDFSQAARYAICFAFRQYVSEKYLNLGGRWEEIIHIYYAGHWPIGFAKNKIIVI